MRVLLLGSTVDTRSYVSLWRWEMIPHVPLQRQLSVTSWHPQDSEPRILRSISEKYKKIVFSLGQDFRNTIRTSRALPRCDRGFMRQFAEAGGISHLFSVKEDSVFSVVTLGIWALFEPCVSGSPGSVFSLPEVYSFFGLSGGRLREVFHVSGSSVHRGYSSWQYGVSSLRGIQCRSR